MRVPITRLTCDTPGCKAAVILEHQEIRPDWFLGKFSDHCPEHAEAERTREWRPFVGAVHGTPGWQSLFTSRIVYQPTMPTTARAHEGESAVEAQ